jgi:Asp-tRNA(Asn)/Glu-tRNA(Gln) amidotransferase A subunit family amidase
MSEPLTITAAAPLLRTGELTPTELLEQCLRRIDIYEPAVKAWAYLDRERARQDAAKATDEIKAGHYRGPLHGIPVGIKDIIDVYDMPTGCGSKLWANSYARQDATCVERLRQAGAIILGKTVTTAYAYLDPPVTRNPWNLTRTPGGSSSGSAAAVACGMCLASLGTQTGGSTIRPASYCGVCALKPTHGRISVNGVLPLAPSLDHIGVMANCVRDLAVVFQTICGPDGDPDYWMSTPRGPTPDCMKVFELRWPQPRVPIAQIGGLFDEKTSPDLRAAYDAALERLQEEWSRFERVVPPVGFNEQQAAHGLMMAVEAAGVHEHRLARHPDDYPPRIRELIETGLASRGTKYRTAFWFQDDLRRQLDQSFGRDRVFVTPATTDFAPTAETTGSPALNSPWSYVGLPVVSVPVGWLATRLPSAIQLVGRFGTEADVLAVALWCESVFDLPRRLPPVPA